MTVFFGDRHCHWGRDDRFRRQRRNRCNSRLLSGIRGSVLVGTVRGTHRGRSSSRLLLIRFMTLDVILRFLSRFEVLPNRVWIVCYSFVKTSNTFSKRWEGDGLLSEYSDLMAFDNSIINRHGGGFGRFSGCHWATDAAIIVPLYPCGSNKIGIIIRIANIIGPSCGRLRAVLFTTFASCVE